MELALYREHGMTLFYCNQQQRITTENHNKCAFGRVWTTQMVSRFAEVDVEFRIITPGPSLGSVCASMDHVAALHTSLPRQTHTPEANHIPIHIP